MTKKENNPVALLNEKYPDLQHSREVGRAALLQTERTGEKSYTGPEKIQSYLDRLESIIFNPDPEKRQRGEELLRKLLLDRAVIEADEIPEGYFDNQQRLARERGMGDIEVTPQVRTEAAGMIRQDQTASLERWLDYLEADGSIYPTWFKYFVVRNILSMSDYDKDKHTFGKRSKGTTKSYPDLNHEALSYVFDAINEHRQNGNLPQDAGLAKLLQGANFSKLYAHAIEKITPASPEVKKETEGKWVKFDQGSDPKKLAESLQGHATGWCVAGEGMAGGYLSVGDFYVFYTKDKDGDFIVPRVAIATKNSQVLEVRGIGDDQNMEESMLDIAKEKYITLPGGDKYEKKDADMKRLTLVDQKNKEGAVLTKDELMFLYEMDAKIEGFGHFKDPRVDWIIDTRVLINDLEIVYDTNNQLSLIDKLINDRRTWMVTSDPNMFQDVDNQTIAELLIDAGPLSASNLIRDLGLFDNVDIQAIALRLMATGQCKLLVRNINNFKDIEHQAILNWMIDSGEFTELEMIFDTFNNVDHQAIAERLIDEGLGEKIANNLHRFNNVDHQAIAERLIDNGQAEPFLRNMKNNHNVDHQAIAERLIDNGQARLFMSYFKEFNNVDHQAIAERLIDIGEAYLLVQYLNYFRGLNNSIWHRLDNQFPGLLWKSGYNLHAIFSEK